MSDFCRTCGAEKPPKFGEGTGPCCWEDVPHRYKGSIDRDCERCGFSIYMYWHTDGFSETTVGKLLNGRLS